MSDFDAPAQRNPAVWAQDIELHMSLLKVMTLHGALCLALRHPQIGERRHTQEALIDLREKLGVILLETGGLTAAELAHVYAVEREAT